MNPLVVFFLIAFGVPWVGWTFLQVFGENLTPLQRILLFYTGDFCSVGGFIAAYTESGRAGVKALWQRCIRVRVSPLWWLLVFLIPFSVALFGAHIWAFAGNEIGPASPSGLLILFTLPLLRNLTTGPIGEEAGWRGYLLPKLLEKFSALTASIIVGFLWGIWHLPIYISEIFSSVSGAASFVISTIFISIVMTAIFNHTKRSVFVAIIFHWFVNKLTLAVLNMYEGVTLEDVFPFLNVGYGLTCVVLVLLMGVDLKLRTSKNAIEQ
ncbi:MAG: CPBP family intramembrane metalloprotease [Gammaproteobacteria bacterium]|nr:CPBP family intramembrane metalloprotease [Gammaproteobacteria bacterium]